MSTESVSCDRCNVVGTNEVASLLGVQPQTVRHWRLRKMAVPFPEPAHLISHVPLWHWEDVEEWAKATGRL